MSPLVTLGSNPTLSAKQIKHSEVRLCRCYVPCQKGVMKYFAYGSNMDAERMRERNISFSQRIHATLKGYSSKFNKVASCNPKEGYANIVPNEKGIVEDVLYEISQSDLPKLDKCEGYPNHYGKIRVKVQSDEGQQVEVVTYIAQPDKIMQNLKPSKDYLKRLLKGRDILPEDYCRRLESWETLD